MELRATRTPATGTGSLVCWQKKASIVCRRKFRSYCFRGLSRKNILCEGIQLSALPVGTRLRIGTALCEVTQIGKECHADCAIRRQAGDCVMPREGIFAVVLEAGEAKAGDEVRVIDEKA